MQFPKKYLCLKNFTIISKDNFHVIPIRYEHRLKIMKWRNEQIYHLRQNKPLTQHIQDQYFKDVISKLFNQLAPDQILFSYLKNNECIGYGGLVHINWKDKNAEISFIINTNLEKDEFELHWKNFLYMIEIIAFEKLKFKKIYTYAFDLRPHLYRALENSNFIKEAVLKDHFYFENSYKSVIIHSKINNSI